MDEFVYIVFGESGAYSDYKAWVVGVHSKKSDAETHAALAEKRSNEIYKTVYSERAENPINEYDAYMHVSYYDPSVYTVLEILKDWKWPGKNE